MIDPEDPPRLRDGADPATAGLRDALRAAERDVGSSEQLARLAARLGPVLAPPAAVAIGSAGLSGGAKLGLGVVALLVAGGGAWLLSTSQSASPPVPISQSGVASVAPAPVQVTPPAAASGAPSPDTRAPQLDAPTPLAAAPTLPAKPAASAQPTEAELLEQARSALKSDPARALSRANAHAARFPGGALVQEREVIAIKALRQLGRNTEADKRAEAFAKAFPGSAFARKLQSAP